MSAVSGCDWRGPSWGCAGRGLALRRWRFRGEGRNRPGSPGRRSAAPARVGARVSVGVGRSLRPGWVQSACRTETERPCSTDGRLSPSLAAVHRRRGGYPRRMPAVRPQGHIQGRRACGALGETARPVAASLALPQSPGAWRPPLHVASGQCLSGVVAPERIVCGLPRAEQSGRAAVSYCRPGARTGTMVGLIVGFGWKPFGSCSNVSLAGNRLTPLSRFALSSAEPFGLALFG